MIKYLIPVLILFKGCQNEFTRVSSSTLTTCKGGYLVSTSMTTYSDKSKVEYDYTFCKDKSFGGTCNHEPIKCSKD